MQLLAMNTLALTADPSGLDVPADPQPALDGLIDALALLGKSVAGRPQEIMPEVRRIFSEHAVDLPLMDSCRLDEAPLEVWARLCGAASDPCPTGTAPWHRPQLRRVLQTALSAPRAPLAVQFRLSA